MHIMQDSTITVTTNTIPRYVVKKFAAAFKNEKKRKVSICISFQKFSRNFLFEQGNDFQQKNEITFLTLC